MISKLEKARGNTPPMLDLETLKSDLVVADIDGSTEDVWPATSWKSFVGWTLAVITAIVVGVLPALWINRWRAEASEAPRQAEAQPEEPAVSPSTVHVEPIEQEPAKAEPATGVGEPAAAPAVAPTKPATIKRQPSRRKVVKQPASHPKKMPPPCDIYLHPHGCPR